MLMQTTVEHFEVLLERIWQEGMSEETKFRAISKWLDAGRMEYDVKERAEAFTKIISRIDLTRLSTPSQTEYWEIVRKYSKSCTAASGSFVLKSVPQLQPDESFNVKVPSHDTLTVLNGTFFDFDLWDVESRFWSVNYRNGCVSKIPFRGAKRTSYSVAARNESIFIFGGYLKQGHPIPTCEKVDTATGEFTRLPDMSLARSRTSALNIPDIGIVVVGGWTANRLNFAEILVEDPLDESGWRWIKLNPMLEGRAKPGIAYFNGCVVVAGENSGRELTVEFLPLTSVEQPTAQWTRLHGVDKGWRQYTSLVAFSNRLIMLTSDGPEGVVYEFSPTEGDNSLANFTWKPLFWVDNVDCARILVTSERLDGS
uniref:Kelch repeat type 1 n=1 Tax=Echinococcus granulosus TaxID=6210 RepID=A0A068WYP9_ECHGR|nr:Kelch repeat type 1 [Echinococcus granulosus]